MIAVVVLFFLTSVRVQNVWAGNELPKDTSLRRSKSISSNPASILNLLDEYDVDGNERLNYPLRWVFPKRLDVCLTQECRKAARAVLDNMNKDADPCENFYEFACGNFIKKTKIPDGQFDQIHIIKDKVADELKRILENSSLDKEARPFRMAKDFYTNCMETNIEEPDLSYIKEIVQRMGGWPILEGDRWDDSKFTWQDTVYKFRDEGFSIDYLISFKIEPDWKNNTKFAIQLDHAELGPVGITFEEYYDKMINFTVMFGVDRGHAAKELKESLDFEIRLAQISTYSPNYYSQYNPLTIPQLQERFPSIPWSEYISNILPKSIKIQPEEVVIVKDPPYINKLENLLATTPKRIQANYMMWRAVYSALPYVTEMIQKTHVRWKECLRSAAEFPSDGFHIVLSSLYVQRFFTKKKETNRSALEMVNSIREEMYKILQTVEWLDNKTRRHALEKAEAMQFYIAYPEEILDVRKVEDYFQKLKITKGKYLEAKLNLTKFEQDFQFGLLRNPLDWTDWRRHTYNIEVNAFYVPNANYVEIPAVILQRPLFSHDRPKYMNYGALGYIIGHEMSHGFDNKGRAFDKDGNLYDWWDPETSKTFIRKADCIIDQYENYTVEQVEMNINGKLTQGENIADNVGIKLAYRAYNRWAEKHGTEKRLPGLREFTPKQMFWISAANTWCSKYSPEALTQQMCTYTHSPGEFRVRGPFSNRPEFANDFKCPIGSKMNPYKKCQVW